MATDGDQERQLGFQGMIAAGMTPEDAYAEIRADTMKPEVRAIFDDLMSTPDGRAALEFSAQRWREHGFEPPWQQPAGEDQARQ